ncbi:MAG: hypothetical protein JWN88_2283 [Frankiales bacterium]|nr:hypothetical protein [Frankiales bacterium]
MSGWQRCDTCRKVRTGTDFDAGATTCRECLAGPAPAVRKRVAPVVSSRTKPRAEAAPTAAAGPRRPLVGAVGSGDLEVRERRARRAAHEALELSHPEEFRLLLRDARAAEGLRPMDTAPPPPVDAGGTPPAPPGAAG